jgi:hypothetical protein
VKRFAPIKKPLSMKKDVEKLLKAWFKWKNN